MRCEIAVVWEVCWPTIHLVSDVSGAQHQWCGDRKCHHEFVCDYEWYLASPHWRCVRYPILLKYHGIPEVFPIRIPPPETQ